MFVVSVFFGLSYELIREAEFTQKIVLQQVLLLEI